MANARTVDAADAVAQLLSVLATESTIRRGNVPIRERTELDGPDIDVYDLRFRPAVERLSRADVLDEHEISVVYTCEYDDQTAANAIEPVPRNWVDEQKYYVESRIEDVLGLKSNRLLTAALVPWTLTYIPEGEVYDPEILVQTKTFRSEIRVVYRELVSG